MRARRESLVHQQAKYLILEMLVEQIGLEPTASALRTRRSYSWRELYRPLGRRPSDRSAMQTVPVSRVAMLGKYRRFYIPSPALHFGTRRMPEILVTNCPQGKHSG